MLLKHSLSFSLQLFRKIIYHTQTLTFGTIAALGAHIALSSSSVSLLPCARAPTSLVAIASTCTKRFTQNCRCILFRFEHWDLKPKPIRLVAIAIVPFLVLRTLSDSTPHSTLPYAVIAPTLLSRSQPFPSSASETDSVHSLISRISLSTQSTSCHLP